MTTARDSHTRGFTLIEVLVVIIMIGILATVAIPVYLSQQDKAKRGATRANMRSLITEITLARENQQASLRTITGNSYSGGSCTSITMPQVTDPAFPSSACGIAWTNAVTKIAAASGSDVQAVKRLMTDGWGHPIILDENEGETLQPDPCKAVDTLGSAGSGTSVPTSPSLAAANPNGIYLLVPPGGFC